MHTYRSNSCTFFFLIQCSHLQDSSSQSSCTAFQPAFALGKLPLPVSKHSCLLDPREPLVHCCHTCCSPLGCCSVPNSASNFHIRITIVGRADQRMSATAVQLLQKDREGEKTSLMTNFHWKLVTGSNKNTPSKCVKYVRLLAYFVNVWQPGHTSAVLGISSIPGFTNCWCSWGLFAMAVLVKVTT